MLKQKGYSKVFIFEFNYEAITDPKIKQPTLTNINCQASNLILLPRNKSDFNSIF